MSRLVRPLIPAAVKLAVVLRQLGMPQEIVVVFVAAAKRGRRLGAEIKAKLFVLACSLGCPADDLQLDHDPALENREKVFICNIHVGYEPAANDPEHLFYRPQSPEFAGSHKIKTLVRGDHGQHSDRALAAKNRKIARNRDPKRRRVKIKSRGFQKNGLKRGWPSRPFKKKPPTTAGGFRK